MKVLKLRRGLGSRLIGDAVLGSVGGSQALAIAVAYVLAPVRGWEWLPIGGLVSLAVAAVSWSYRLEGTRIVGGFFGLRLVDAELRGAKVRLETAPAGYVATTDVIVIVGATIHRSLSLFDRGSSELRLGYSMWIGRRRREFWLSQIRSRT